MSEAEQFSEIEASEQGLGAVAVAVAAESEASAVAAAGLSDATSEAKAGEGGDGLVAVIETEGAKIDASKTEEDEG